MCWLDILFLSFGRRRRRNPNYCQWWSSNGRQRSCLRRKSNGIRILLLFLCFRLSIETERLPNDLKAMDLFLHIITAHFGDSFDQFPFKRGSTEDGERFISKLKRILRLCTNRRRECAMKEPFYRWNDQFTTDLLSAISQEEIIEILSEKEGSIRNKKFKDRRDDPFLIFDIVVPIPAENDQSHLGKSTNAFIAKIKKLFPTFCKTDRDDFFLVITESIKSYLYTPN